MISKGKILRLFLSVLCASAVFLLGGCGERELAPDPPRARAQLVLDLFAALEKGDHKTAVGKIARLRKLEPGNIFLANLESIEKNNIIVSDVQSSIDGGKIDGAFADIQVLIKKHGKSDFLAALESELDDLKQIKELAEALNNPERASFLARNSAKLKTIASRYKPAEIFIPFANKKLTDARKMMSWEKKLAIEDLCSDINLFLCEKAEFSETLFAILAIESPEHPALENYLNQLQK